MFPRISVFILLVIEAEPASVGDGPRAVGKRETELAVLHSTSVLNIGNGELLRRESGTEKRTIEIGKRWRMERGRKIKEKARVKNVRKNTEGSPSGFGRMERNDEKDILVRNRTIEIIKNGFRILSANEKRSGSDVSFGSEKEDLTPKMMSSGFSEPDSLISATGKYRLPIGLPVGLPRVRAADNKKNIRSDPVEAIDAREGSPRRKGNARVGSKNIRNHSSEFPPSVNEDEQLKIILQKIMEKLRDEPDFKKNVGGGCGGKEESDPCAKWLECKNRIEKVFSGRNLLPSCPCNYPGTIFHSVAIWDRNRKKSFRWKDASDQAERLHIYKPGAVFCIRSLPLLNGAAISSQQCCYDEKLRLLTRGSGTGTINFVSPEISRTLHDTVDVLPWRLCKGDFTRYNLARNPDNGNGCPVNPKREQYELEIKSSKYFR